MKRTIFLVVTILLVSAFGAKAENVQVRSEKPAAVRSGWTPFQFSVFNPLQLFNENKSIAGMRFTIFYGKNTDLHGIDLGLCVNSTHNLTGIQLVGLMNNAAGDPGDFNVTGIQVAGLGNTTDHLSGIQIGGFGNGVTYDATGIQIGLIGNAAATFKGIQIAGLFNFNYDKSSSMSGIQIGIFNYSDKVTGIQIGLFNDCNEMKGIQIGILNHIENGRMPYMPIINAKF